MEGRRWYTVTVVGEKPKLIEFAPSVVTFAEKGDIYARKSVLDRVCEAFKRPSIAWDDLTITLKN
jgi:hypothetical protein